VLRQVILVAGPTGYLYAIESTRDPFDTTIVDDNTDDEAGRAETGGLRHTIDDWRGEEIDIDLFGEP